MSEETIMHVHLLHGLSYVACLMLKISQCSNLQPFGDQLSTVPPPPHIQKKKKKKKKTS